MTVIARLDNQISRSNMRYSPNVTSPGRIEGAEIFYSSCFSQLLSTIFVALFQVKPLSNRLIQNDNAFTRI